MARIYHDVEVRRFPDLSQVSPADVEWLLDGVQPDGANLRRIAYVSRRGTVKEVGAVRDGAGAVRWQSCSRGTGRKVSMSARWGSLTNEEARVFAPETAADRDARKTAAALESRRIEEERRATGEAVRLGDVFEGCYFNGCNKSVFYEVVALDRGARFAVVRRIGCDWKGGEDAVNYFVRPKRGAYIGGPKRHRVRWFGPEPSLTDGCLTLTRCDPNEWTSNFDR